MMTDNILKTQDKSTYTRFFAPLALQAASQGLTYPLVAMVASRGPGGPLNLAGLAQSNTLMYMLGTFGFGLVTAGMVFGRTRDGYLQFRAVTLRIGLLVTLAQGLLCIPQAAHLLFGRLIGLPPSIEYPAAMTLLATVPLQFLFFIRIPFQVAMYNARATGKASLATILRILLTAILSPLFCLAGAVGPLWAVVCLSFPVGLEVAASAWLARPYLARLEASAAAPTKKEIFLFNLPLSIGGYLLSLSSILLGAFIARAASPERMLPAYYLALGPAPLDVHSAGAVRSVLYQASESRSGQPATCQGRSAGPGPVSSVRSGSGSGRRPCQSGGKTDDRHCGTGNVYDHHLIDRRCVVDAWNRWKFHRRHRSVLRQSGIHSNASSPAPVDQKSRSARSVEIAWHRPDSIDGLALYRHERIRVRHKK